MPQCPICGEEFGASGLHPHIRSHEKSELVSIAAQLAKGDHQQGQTETRNHETTWHQTAIRRREISHLRNERNRKVKQHLEQLDTQIKETLR